MDTDGAGGPRDPRAFGVGLEGQTENGAFERMRETEEKRGLAKGKPAGRDECGRPRDKEEPCETDELTVPDYVMRDFGPLEEEECDGGIRT